MFSATTAKTSPSKPKAADGDDDGDDDAEDDAVEEDTVTTDFAIVKLPEAMKEVKTGEEGETSLYVCRGKLYVFGQTNEGQAWKERGTGDIKLLRDDKAGTVRFVMRRDIVHKICANHYVKKDMKYEFMPGNEKAITWVAPDSSEGETVIEKFSLRLKNKEEATAFKSAIDQAQKDQ